MRVPLTRDLPSLALIGLSCLSARVLHLQLEETKMALTGLLRSGALALRVEPSVTSIRERRLVDELMIDDSASGTGPLFRRYVSSLDGLIARRELVALMLSPLLAVALHWLAARPGAFERRVTSAMSGGDRGLVARQMADSWWASWEHVPGALFFVLVATVGVATILVQNVVAASSVSLLLKASIFVDVSLNLVDQRYPEWDPLRRVYRVVYLSMAIRALGLVGVILLLGGLNQYADAGLALLWSLFLVVYLYLPNRRLTALLSNRREAAIKELKQSISGPARSRDDLISLALTQFSIMQMRAARLNPIGLAGWQASGFGVVFALPVVLALAQIVFS